MLIQKESERLIDKKIVVIFYSKGSGSKYAGIPCVILKVVKNFFINILISNFFVKIKKRLECYSRYSTEARIGKAADCVRPKNLKTRSYMASIISESYTGVEAIITNFNSVHIYWLS